MKLTVIPSLLAACLFASGAGSADAPGPNLPPAQLYLERLATESSSPGVSAAVMVNGHLAFSGGVGVANVESQEPQSGETVHNIGSVSKTQAVVAVLQLVEFGKVRLDAEIQTYAPWFPRKSQPITLRQILTHTSGIRHYKQNDFGPDGLNAFKHYENFEESTRFWREDPLLFEPGTHWSYSSYAVDLLQAVVESASGQSYERYMTEHVWAPSGMTTTELDLPSRIVRRRGRGYIWNTALGRMENAPNEDVSYKYAGGGVISSDQDLARFGHALNSGLLLRRETVAEMYRLQLPPNIPRFEDKTSPPIGAIQGLVFRVGKNAAGHPYAWHTGSVKGTTSEILDFYADDVVVALYFNYGPGPVDIEAAAHGLAALYLPQKQPASGSASLLRH